MIVYEERKDKIPVECFDRSTLTIPYTLKKKEGCKKRYKGSANR